MIRSIQGQIIPDSDTLDEIRLNDEIVSTYGLDRWAARFSLMTAGYRDHMDPDNAANPEIPFNIVTVALMAEAKGRVLRRRLKKGETGDVHLGGEVRANTQTFIQIAARIYAAQGYNVHLRSKNLTSPIWYSSFGVFYEEYQSGDNFTASHSPYFKQGWKVLDSEGKQLTEGEDEIIHEIRRLVADRTVIRLAPWRSSGRIFSDFDVDQAYADYQRSVLGAEVFASIGDAASHGFKTALFTLGGSMGATSKRILDLLDIPEAAFTYFLDKEDPRFHRVGEIGAHNYGADVGKPEVCANTGAPEKVLTGDADLALLWDPDGDRLNVITTAPIQLREKAIDCGLHIGPGNDKKMIVYFTPNQLYLLFIRYRINLLRRLHLLDQYDWFVVTTFPSAMAIEELAAMEGLPTIQVPVGFRNLGDLCRNIERNIGTEQTITTLAGQQIRLGRSPRPLLLCEESGGASFGGPKLLTSRNGKQTMLALREKDGLQLGLLAWSLAGSLHSSDVSLAEAYCDVMLHSNIKYRYSGRIDAALYDESLTGDELKSARAEGMRKCDQVVSLFRDAVAAFAGAGTSPNAVLRRLTAANLTAAPKALSTVKLAVWIGDGTMFEMEGARLIVRASGTDALIRYYMEATSPERLENLEKFIKGLSVA